MPRVPLKEISANTARGKELTPYQRGIIVGRAAAGDTVHAISRDLNICVSTVKYTLAKAKERDQGNSVQRTGRPKSYTDRDERRILRIVQLEPKITYQNITRLTGIEISRGTLYNIISKHGIKNWLSKKRPILTEKDAQRRLEWALAHQHWLEEWEWIIWSDECSIVRGSGKQRPWVFRTPQQKWDKEMITGTAKGKGVSVMVWAAISIRGGASDLIILDRDFESKKMGFSAKSYLAVLERALPTLWEPGFTFMQDNAPIHKAKAVTQWFTDMAIPVMGWPPHSPDLNPIEHLWFPLKSGVYEVSPGIDDLTGPENIRQALESAVCEAWPKIKAESIRGILGSMPQRIQAVIEAKGWYTKY